MGCIDAHDVGARALNGCSSVGWLGLRGEHTLFPMPESLSHFRTLKPCACHFKNLAISRHLGIVLPLPAEQEPHDLLPEIESYFEGYQLTGMLLPGAPCTHVAIRQRKR